MNDCKFDMGLREDYTSAHNVLPLILYNNRQYCYKVSYPLLLLEVLQKQVESN